MITKGTLTLALSLQVFIQPQARQKHLLKLVGVSGQHFIPQGASNSGSRPDTVQMSCGSRANESNHPLAMVRAPIPYLAYLCDVPWIMQFHNYMTVEILSGNRELVEYFHS